MKKIIAILIFIFAVLRIEAQRVHDYNPALRGQFYVQDYGADRTGATESTTAIQAALNACDSGTVHIPAGYYVTGTLIIPNDNITIQGDGEFTTKLQLKDAADASTAWGVMFYVANVDNIIFSDLELIGNGANQTKIDNRGGTNLSKSIGICANDSTGTYFTDKITVKNCFIHDFARTGVVWSRGNEMSVNNCFFNNNYVSGVEFWGLTKNGRIDNCVFRKNTGISLFGDKHTVSDCTFEYPYNANMWDAYDFGISLESATYGPDDVMISNCVFKGDTLTYGIFSATNGMRNLTINNVYIKSSDADHYAILMQNDTSTMIINSHIIGTKYGITLNDAQYSTVSNNHIDGGALMGVQLGADADNNNIHSNYIRKTAGYPVYINSGATNNVIANNILAGTWYGGIVVDAGTGTVQLNNYSVLDGSKMPDAVAENIANSYIATADGLTTGLLSAGSQNITLTSANANYIICLPLTSAANIGQVITGQVGANGFELRPIAAQAATVYINGVTTNVEAAIPANSSFEIRCIDATHWILKAWTALGAEITAIIPDAI